MTMDNDDMRPVRGITTAILLTCVGLLLGLCTYDAVHKMAHGQPAPAPLNLTATSPITVTPSGVGNLPRVIACPTCGAGSGDVVGPGSSTEGHVATFSGTSGKIIQDSSLINVTVTTNPLILDSGSGAFPNIASLPAGTTYLIGAPDATASRMVIEAFGNNPNITGIRAQGTRASPTAVANNSIIMQSAGYGYGATGFSSSARATYSMMAAETWTDSAQGTRMTWSTTPTGSTTIAEGMRLTNAAHLLIGTTTDTGSNLLQVAGGGSFVNLTSTGLLSTNQVYTTTVTQSGTTYTLVDTDCGTTLRFTSNSAITLTLTSTILPGCYINVAQIGTGQITVTNGTGTAFHNPHSYTKTFGQYAVIGLYVQTNSGGSAADYLLFGDGA